MDKNAIKNVMDEVGKALGTFDDISLQEIEDTIKNQADEQLEFTKKKYMNELLRNKLGTIESLIKQKDIKVDNEESHVNFIDNLFSENLQKIKDELGQVYSQMAATYSDENWSEKWHSLMDGKSVFG